MPDGADIALPDTGVPVELDRIYASLRDLTEALGPNGVNKDGTLNHLLEAGAKALDGQGQRGNEMIRKLSAAAADVRRRQRAAVRHRRGAAAVHRHAGHQRHGWCGRS